MTTFQTAPVGPERPYGDNAPWLVEFLQDPPLWLLLLGILCTVGAVALCVHVCYNKGVPYDLHWEVLINVAIVQTMYVAATEANSHALSTSITIAFAAGCGFLVYLTGRVGQSKWATERGIIAGWAVLSVVWLLQGIGIGITYDGRLSLFYALLGMIAWGAILYVMIAGERPWREVRSELSSTESGV